MTAKLTGYKIFVAAPGGLEAERALFLSTIQDYNLFEAIHDGLQFIPMRWEETLGGLGRPQELINEDLKECDYMILLLWDRWGSRTDSKDNTRGYSAGVEEEFHIALECCDDPEMPMRDIVVFFRDIDDRRLSDPGKQLSRVLKFKKTLQNEKTCLSDNYEKPDDFANRLRSYLGKWVRVHKQNTTVSRTVHTSFLARTYKTINHIPLPGEKTPPAGSNLSEKLRKAKTLADAGKVTEAETMFAGIVTDTATLWSKNEYAKFLFRIGKRIKAEDLYKSILKDAKKANNVGWLGRASANFGIIAESRGELIEAEKRFLDSLKYNERLNHKEGIADSKRHLSIIHRMRGNLSTALSYGDESLSIYRELEQGGKGGLADTYADMGVVHRILGDLDIAEQYYTKSLDINEDGGKRSCRADYYGQLGTVHRVRGNLKLAMEYYTKAKTINEELERKQGLADDLGRIGLIHLLKADHDDAKSSILGSLEINEELQNKEGMAKQYTSLARYLWAKRRYRDAENTLGKSRRINRGIGSKEGIASDYYNFGTLYMLSGDNNLASTSTGKSIDINEEIGCKEGICNGYLQLANLNRHSNKFQRARELVDQALAIGIKQGFGLVVAEGNYTFGRIFSQEGKEPKAAKHLRSAMNMYDECGVEAMVIYIKTLLNETEDPKTPKGR